ncbi:MAG: metal-sensitive transcriptional regulator [Acetobacteraceae bacterium]|nr:metal-sensitive transcriptional regulator [Acetobacteraceae bacterium]
MAVRYGPDRAKLLERLRKVEGQVRGLARMLEDGREGAEVLVQIAAARAALARVALGLLAAETRSCVAESARSSRGLAGLDELLEAWARFMG